MKKRRGAVRTKKKEKERDEETGWQAGRQKETLTSFIKIKCSRCGLDLLSVLVSSLYTETTRQSGAHRNNGYNRYSVTM